VHLFFVVNPWEWANVIIEFRQSWEVKVEEITFGEEVARNAKMVGGGVKTLIPASLYGDLPISQ
jgi:hypothetical protein